MYYFITFLSNKFLKLLKLYGVSKKKDELCDYDLQQLYSLIKRIGSSFVMILIIFIVSFYFRVYWFLIFFLMMFITFTSMSALINVWINSPTVMFIENTESAISEIPFPQIIICSSNQLRKSVWEKYKNTNSSYW